MLSNARTPQTRPWWLTTVVVRSSSSRFVTRLRRYPFSLRRPLAVCLAVLLAAAVISTLMFSDWNVCRPDLDDDVDALIANAAATRSVRVRRPGKICLSPQLTGDGVRVSINLDLDADLRR